MLIERITFDGPRGLVATGAAAGAEAEAGDAIEADGIGDDGALMKVFDRQKSINHFIVSVRDRKKN